jgi:sterol 14alpha-demethylase
MGILQEVAGPVAQQFQSLSTPAQVGAAVGAFVVLSIAWHIISQLLFANPNEPPVVFSWFPFIGSTVTYGMDPPAFFKKQQAKVRFRAVPSASPCA